MTSSNVGGPRPNSSGQAYGRQVTLGEAIAMARFTREATQMGLGPYTALQLLRMCDHEQVCTTCGWPVQDHHRSRNPEARRTACAHHTRQL